MAPEYRYFGQFTLKSDIYSLGVMLFEILTSIRWSRRNHTPQIQNLRSHVRSLNWIIQLYFMVVITINNVFFVCRS